MLPQLIIEKYQNAIIQIATKTGTGTGFYVKEFDLIVTNYHVVRDTAYASIQGKIFRKQLSKVGFVDEKYDLAFLMPPVDEPPFPEFRLGRYEDLHDGDSVLAIGHPYGLNYTATQGVVSKVDRVQQGIKFIQIDAAINPGNSGGPLVNEQGEVVGINSFIIKGGDNLGFALPVSYLRVALEEYAPHRGEISLRCPSCSILVTEQTLDNGEYCPNCGTKIEFPNKENPEGEPSSGIVKTVEDILEGLGYNKELARCGTHKWEIETGSAKVKIGYNPDNYFIMIDAFLCRLPEKNIGPLYLFLLNENYLMKGLFFSTNRDNIVLSSMVYDMDLNTRNGTPLFQKLFDNADRYDNLLMEKYQCRAILEEN